MILPKKTRGSSMSSPKPTSRSQPSNRTMALQPKTTIKNPITTRKSNSSSTTNRKRVPLTKRRLPHITSKSSLLREVASRPTLMINEQAKADNEYT